MPPVRDEPFTPNKFLAFLAWKKMNTKVARQNLPDDECAWAENLQPIGPNSWQTVNAAAAAFATVTGKTVTRIFPATIGAVDYLMFFATDGSLTAINVGTGAQTTVAGPATFSATPDLTVWASQRVLIQDLQKGYFTWDGTLAVAIGGLSPNINVTNGGSGYSAAPAVSFTGGSGSGATATAVMGGSGAAQFVVSVTLTNPGSGYLPGDAITVVFTGANTTPATATARIWPQTTGSTIAVFAGRVWWVTPLAGSGRRVLNFTGTAGFDDTNVANAAGSTTVLDSDLNRNINALRNLNNYLYILGDHSVRQIGSITVASSITLFTPLTLASDIGCPSTFMMTIQSYNRLVLFANKAGVYGIFGASIRKISDDLDGIFQLVDFSLNPSAALNDFHQTLTAGGSIHCYILLVRYLDPVQGTRTLLLCYQNDQWFIVSQGSSLLAICPIFLSSPATNTQQWDIFASSGADVTQLLQTPNTNVTILFKSALSSNRAPIQPKRLVHAGVAVTTAIAQSFMFAIETENSTDQRTLNAASVINWVNNQNQPVTWQNNSLATVSFIGGGYRWPYTEAGGEGKVIGGTVSGSVQQFALNAMAFEYVDTAMWGTIP